MSDILQQYRDHVERVNRATDAEINEAMDAILRKQSQVNVLRPGRRRPVDKGAVDTGKSGER